VNMEDVDVVMEELDVSSDEYCEIAFEEAQMMCATPELVFVQASRFMGFMPHEIDELLPLDETYQNIVSNGVGTSFASMRQWILARAWDLHVNEGESVVVSFQVAWQEVMTGETGA